MTRRHVRPRFDFVRPSHSLSSPLSTAFDRALHDDLTQAVVTHDIREPLEIPPFDRGEQRFLPPRENFGFAPHEFVGLVLQVGDTKELSQTFVLKRLNSSFCLRVKRPGLTSV